MANISLTMDNYSNYEVMKANWYAIYIPEIGSASGNDASALSIACHNCTLPKLTTDENEHHRINDIVYTPGKSKWDSISLEFYEFMKSAGTDNESKGSGGNLSAGEILKSWQTDVHDPITGRNGSKAAIAKDLVIVQINGEGEKIRTWNVYNAWPTDVEFDAVDSKTGDQLNVKCTLRFDYAVMLGDDSGQIKGDTEDEGGSFSGGGSSLADRRS